MKKVITFLLIGLGISIILIGYLLYRGNANKINTFDEKELASLDVSYAVSPVYSLELTSLDGNQIRMADYLESL